MARRRVLKSVLPAARIGGKAGKRNQNSWPNYFKTPHHRLIIPFPLSTPLIAAVASGPV